MELIVHALGLLLTISELHAQVENEESNNDQSTSLPLIDISEDFDRFEIEEYEDTTNKVYHCTVRDRNGNGTLPPGPEVVKYLDENGLLSARSKINYYHVREVRRKLCQFGFDPFRTDRRSGSIHKRFKNTLRLMVYNTPAMFPGLRVTRNDLDRRRKREPQIWFRFEATAGPFVSEFDYDNYFVTVTGDLSRIQAYSRLLVALKMHKRLNNFDDPVSCKINLDLGLLETILTSFGIWIMKEKSVAPLLVTALNGIRTEIEESGEVRLEFEQSLKEAADKIDPVLYPYVWLLSMAEKFETVKPREKKRKGASKRRNRIDE